MSHFQNNISFIIVNFRSVTELLRCLRDLAILPNAHLFEVIIINNDSNKLQLPQYKFFRQKCVEINENIGYSKANNIGLNHVSTSFVCFLNPDTHSFSQNFCSIIDHLQPRVIASPLILSENKMPQRWSNGEKISLWQIFKNNFGIHKKTWLAQSVTPVHWVCGAALCSTTQFLRELNGFDESFFLYFEDVDLCERAHLLGGSVYFLPHVSLIHTAGQSSKKTSKFQKKCYYNSQDHYFNKHVGVLQSLLLRVLRLLHK